MSGSHTTVNAFGPHVTVLTQAPPAAGAPAVRISVDNNHCELYGICQQEAPQVFDLGPDGRLRYETSPDASQTPAVRQAARCCPMQAITLANREKQ
ncbi:ferredoxin [Streptomyces puniciscabiei]|uniref:ferredoxin n=1 Tax=Streptomyces puniciscabiei TaxID=164348 RepID=UPI00332D4FD0